MVSFGTPCQRQLWRRFNSVCTQRKWMSIGIWANNQSLFLACGDFLYVLANSIAKSSEFQMPLHFLFLFFQFPPSLTAVKFSFAKYSRLIRKWIPHISKKSTKINVCGVFVLVVLKNQWNDPIYKIQNCIIRGWLTTINKIITQSIIFECRNWTSQRKKNVAFSLSNKLCVWWCWNSTMMLYHNLVCVQARESK